MPKTDAIPSPTGDSQWGARYSKWKMVFGPITRRISEMLRDRHSYYMLNCILFSNFILDAVQ